ncbi:hypothetical protein SAMN02744037_02314 [Tepidibacter formicigenes DSM 15518]|uniref:NUMOD1 domain-containing protein n=1 Tax=Tepidibacter formicigenes DSM 15518 TaxID=1123349 RepID=A0A1M6SCU1_9FIRM|nr:hypothetical protein SAMN02744037_02314 [Tepidibacter formicigenes DSM 15518]
MLQLTLERTKSVDNPISNETIRKKILRKRQEKFEQLTPHNSRPVVCVETGKKFLTTGRVANFLGVTRKQATSGLYKVLNGIQETYKGYHFILAES